MSIAACLATLLAALVLSSSPCEAEAWPAAKEETLRYVVTWPSGLDLGEATLKAVFGKSPEGEPRWEFTLELEAALPAFAVNDRYHASASADLCSEALELKQAHGRRKRDETLTFDAQSGRMVRQTTGGGRSEIPVPSCAKDALTFFYFVRSELMHGRIPPPQPIYGGAVYQCFVRYAGQEQVQIGAESRPADKFSVFLKGPASETRLEVLFGRDAGRTPLAVRVPFEMGLFSMILAP